VCDSAFKAKGHDLKLEKVQLRQKKKKKKIYIYIYKINPAVTGVFLPSLSAQ
jgi:hypothetical protein